jgi:hypothetical protein
VKLNFEVVETENITTSQKEEMFHLLDRHYNNVRWSDFITDLSEKHQVILLRTPENHQMVGFSTQLTLFPELNSGIPGCVVIFSGDTIIAQEYWGSVALPMAFLQLITKIQKQHPGKKIYWMLISKGLRTYKFLSVFLKEYYPNFQSATPPPIQQLMHYLGHQKFGLKYDPEIGIIKASTESQSLKPQFQPTENKENAVARFFYEKNPGYQKGDELLCLAELSEYNLHPFVKRLINQSSDEN